MIQYCKKNLEEIKSLLQVLPKEHYTFPVAILSNATIGEHVRHILEFYKCLIDGIACDVVNYDERKRDKRIQTDAAFASYFIQDLVLKLDGIHTDKPLYLDGNYSYENGEAVKIPSSLFRELTYCLEHSIHHQALIKVALVQLEGVSLIDETFGVAPATIRFQKSEN